MSETALVPSMGRGITFRDVSDIERFATLIHKTSLVPNEYRNKIGDCIAVMAFGLELGLNPMQSLQSIAFVNGKPSVYGDMLLALVRTSGLLEWIHESPPHEIDGTQKAVCIVKRKGEDEVVREFSLAMAQQAGLVQKGGVWKSYPSRMLQMRARSWALRDTFPDVLKGLYAREEAEDITLTMGAMPVTREPAPIPVETTDEGDTVKAFLLQEITNSLKVLVPGESMDARKQRLSLMADAFGVRGFGHVKLLPVEKLQSGYRYLQEQIQAQEAPDDEDDIPEADTVTDPAIPEMPDTQEPPSAGVYASAADVAKVVDYANAHHLGSLVDAALRHYPNGVTPERLAQIEANLKDRVDAAQEHDEP